MHLLPYLHCMQWLKKNFLGYLDEWQRSVEQREGFTTAQKQMMCLSKETLTGLKITGRFKHACIMFMSHWSHIMCHFISTVHSFIEMAEYLFKQPRVQYLFSERLTQDPLECFFGKQRACGGRNENPSARQFLDNTVSLRVQGCAALDPVRGNCRERKQIKNTQSVIDETPLPKRRRKNRTDNDNLYM